VFTPLISQCSRLGASSAEGLSQGCSSTTSRSSGGWMLLRGQQTTWGPFWGPTGRPYVSRARVMALLISRNHSTELATAVQYSQSLALKAAVENACCRNGT
jgi:hypothetical protein